MDREVVHKRLEELLELCRREGIKATHQRLEVMRVLSSTEEHPDAESVYEKVRQKIPTISLDTVYRTLRMFEKRGLVARVGPICDRARFDANTNDHHHFICAKCGLVRDFYSDILDSFHPPREVGQIGQVDVAYLELRGLCNRCREK